MSKIITIEKIVNRGSGMGYDENSKVVFVPFTAVGDVVETEIVKSKRTFEIGSIKSIVEKSNQRIEANCPHFGVCGGCSFQHISYKTELETKKRLGDEIFNYDLGEVFTTDEEFAYRNKVTFHASYRSGKLNLGFMMASSNRQVNINKCYLVSDFVNIAKDKIEKLDIKNLEQVVFRVDDKKRFLLINFLGTDKKGDLPKIFKKNSSVFEDLVNENNEKVEVIKFFNSEKLDKKSCFETALNSVKYQVSTDDFFQVNYGVASKIYSDIKEEISKDEDINYAVDGFCGSMTIALQLKDLKLEKIFGIEINEHSVKQAKDNISLNKTRNIKVLNGDFNKLIKGLEMDFKKGVLIVDPPRDGIGAETMKFINNLGFKKIVYLSCDQMTLKRDITELKDYTLSFNRVYNMFPRTFHVETLLIFDKD